MPALREMLRTAQEARATDWTQYRSLLDSITGDPSAEQTAELERMDTALQTRTAEIDRLNRALEFETADGTPGPEPDVPAGGDNEYRTAFLQYLRTGVETRALAVGTDSAGGYLVPDGFRNFLQERLKLQGAVRSVATVLSTSEGNPIEWPTVDETGVVGAIISENTQVSEQDVAFGIATLGAYKYTSKLVRVPNELLEDSAVNVEEYVGRALADRVTRITNTHFTTGTGTGQPQGIVTGATSGVTAAGAAAITADELIDLELSVDPAYHDNGAFMMAPATVGKIRKLKTTDGQYIWQPGLQAGVPDALYGRRLIINPDMPAATTGNKSVLFGDFRRAYVIREVRSFRVLRLEERYADYDQIGLLGFARMDGKVQDAYAMRALTQA